MSKANAAWCERGLAAGKQKYEKGGLCLRAENDLGRDNISTLVWRMALPSMLAQFVSVLYSVVDRMYIGNIPHIGAQALAGVGVCGPVVTMLGSTATLVGVGGAPLAAISMGEGNIRYAKKILSNCMLLLGIFSAAILLFVLPLRKPILLAFGASGTTYQYAEQYFFIYLLGTPFALAAAGLNQFIICQGFARTGMKSVLLGAVANILLDPIFIFGLRLGVRGGALATIISQCAAGLYVLYVLTRKTIPLHLHVGGYSLKIMRSVLCFGMTPFLIVALDNVVVIVMNMILQYYGGAQYGDLLITCATIAQSFMLVVTMPLGGISAGTQGLLSFNYGACNTERVRMAFRVIVRLCMGYAAVMFVLSWSGGPLFVRLFTDDAVVSAQAVRAIRICALFLVPLGAQYAIVDALTALGQVRLSLPLSLGRKAVYLTSMMILPLLGDVSYVFFAEPLSDCIAPMISWLVLRRSLDPILERRAQVGIANARNVQAEHLSNQEERRYSDESNE